MLSNQIDIARDEWSPALRNRLLRVAAFQNPEFYKAQAMRLSTYDKPRVIACAEDYLIRLLARLQKLGTVPVIDDGVYSRILSV